MYNSVHRNTTLSNKIQKHNNNKWKMIANLIFKEKMNDNDDETE